MVQHPDDFTLETYRTGEEPEGGVSTHVEGCEECRARLALLRQLGDALSPPAVVVPEAVEAAILEVARKRAALGRRPGPRVRWLAVAAPVAAAAALIIALIPMRDQSAPTDPARAPGSAVAQSAPGDVNADGVVDIADALLLARAVEGGRASPRFDLDGDAQVDMNDVDHIALAAVSLGGPL